MRKQYTANSMFIERNGEPEEIFIDGYVEYHIEPNWGSDADGNRGIERVIVDRITQLGFYSDDLKEIKPTEEEELEAQDILRDTFLENGVEV